MALKGQAGHIALSVRKVRGHMWKEKAWTVQEFGLGVFLVRCKCNYATEILQNGQRWGRWQSPKIQTSIKKHCICQAPPWKPSFARPLTSTMYWCWCLRAENSMPLMSKWPGLQRHSKSFPIQCDSKALSRKKHHLKIDNSNLLWMSKPSVTKPRLSPG